jgi:hypothetical protein
MKKFLDTKALSGLFELNLKDFIKGAVIAVLAALVDLLINQFSTGEIKKDEIILVAVVSFLAYIKSQFISNEVGDLLTK